MDHLQIALWTALLVTTADADVPMGTIADLRPTSLAGVDAAPSLAIVRGPSELTITFDGTLLSAPSVVGPWTEVPNAVSPYRTSWTAAAGRYFRARVDNSEGLFDSAEVLELALTGPFQTHFELAFAGMPDGIFPPKREKPYFHGSVGLASLTLPSDVRVRGNSSLQECPFPKLKFKISRDDREGTPFEQAREVNIGTHCAEGGQGPVGRLRDETATYREALAYEVMQTLEFTSPKVRRARITYTDTSEPGPNEAEGWTVTRQAVVIENAEVVGERLGGRSLSDEEIAALEDAAFDSQTIAGLRLLHALLGNWDYALSLDGSELWNTDVLLLADGRYEPLAGDFDLASWVTGVVRLNAPHDYHPELPDLERESMFQVSQVRRSIPEALFNVAKRRFLDHRSTLDQLVASARIDDEGRNNALRHLQAFWTALESK